MQPKPVYLVTGRHKAEDAMVPLSVMEWSPYVLTIHNGLSPTYFISRRSAQAAIAKRQKHDAAEPDGPYRFAEFGVLKIAPYVRSSRRKPRR